MTTPEIPVISGVLGYNGGNEIRSGPGDVCTIPRPDTKGLALVPDHSIPTTTQDTTEEIPYGYCHCGCGQKTRISRENNARYGFVIGEPRRFLRGHYMKWKGRVTKLDPIVDGDVVRIPLHSIKYPGLYALVDLIDLDRVEAFRWHPLRSETHQTFYAQTTTRGGTREDQDWTLLHRFILELEPGDPFVDHVNGHGLDCRRTNLRLSSHSDNSSNRARNSHKTGSQFKGVHKSGLASWVARIAYEGVISNLGYFDNEIEAALAYDEAARRIHGEFAAVNFARPGERSAILGDRERSRKAVTG